MGKSHDDSKRLSRRDTFAAAALTGLIARSSRPESSMPVIADAAVAYAEHLLDALDADETEGEAQP